MAAPVGAPALLLLGVFSIAFTRVDPNNTALVLVIVALIGFFTYGAHILMVGHAAQDFGRKEGAAGAALICLLWRAAPQRRSSEEGSG